jgi:hypothetical protein
VPVPILVSDPPPRMALVSVRPFDCVSMVALPPREMALPTDRPLAAACKVVPPPRSTVLVPSALLLPIASVPALTVVPPV